MAGQRMQPHRMKILNIAPISLETASRKKSTKYSLVWEYPSFYTDLQTYDVAQAQV
jgi:hypothetical protein